MKISKWDIANYKLRNFANSASSKKSSSFKALKYIWSVVWELKPPSSFLSLTQTPQILLSTIFWAKRSSLTLPDGRCLRMMSGAVGFVPDKKLWIQISSMVGKFDILPSSTFPAELSFVRLDIDKYSSALHPSRTYANRVETSDLSFHS